MEAYMWAIWLGIFVIALIVEAIGADLVSVWFAGGALIALILSFIPGVAWWIQLIVFCVLSLTLLLALRPLTRKWFRGKIVKSNVESLIGKKAVLLEKIDLLHRGEVAVGDVKWTAVGVDDDAKIEKGKIVVIVAVSGNKLIVKEAGEITPEEGE